MKKQLLVFGLVSSPFVMATIKVFLDFAIHIAPLTEAHLAVIRPTKS